jgi:nitrogen fixation/metabolism regulation signal transduction histidine kinase
MTLRTKITGYLVLIHVLLGAVAVFALRERPIWLLVAEGLFVVSIFTGVMLVRSFFVPLDLVRTGAELIRERDFGSRFREVGQPEMDVLIGIYNEMIDQLREERLKLEEQHVLLDKILHASPAGLMILDFDGRISLYNPSAQAMLRLSAERPIGKRLDELESALGQALARVRPGDSELLPMPGGRRVRGSRIPFRDRGFERSFLLIEELTEELRASEKSAYGKLIRMMSHEVNNTVGAVRSLLQSCSSYASQLRPEDRDDFASAIEVSSTRLDHLNRFMNGFADVVRLPAPERRPTDVRRLVEDVLVLMRADLERRRVHARLETRAELPEIRLDKHHFEQALVNILKNSAESIGADGEIVVELGREGGRAYLTVRDTGKGIPEEVQDRLFTPFFTTKPDGRGIGLTVIREILGGHGFDYTLSGAEGHGAEFRIAF